MIDTVAAARQQEDTDRLPFIAVLDITTDYEPQPDGSQKAVEWVTWVKKGTQNPSTNVEKISRLMKYPDNPVWQVIKPLYERWKAGQEAPIDGTPLIAWPGATKELVKALAPANIRSVEDLARMEDSAIQRMGIPGLRQKQTAARAFLEAQKSTAQVSGEVVKLRSDNEMLRAKVDELMQAVNALAEEKGISITEEQPKRRGRPPKQAA